MITDVDQVVCDRAPTADFDPVIEALCTKISFAEKAE
jgi:hypothetical protein